MKDLWNQEEMYWGASTRINWLKCGDRNSKFFHASTMQRRAINTIHGIKDKNRRWIEDYGEIMVVFKDSFDELFRANDGVD